MKNKDEKYWKKLWRNVNMSAETGSAGMRIESNPKKTNPIVVARKKGNQSTKRHKITITIEDLKDLWRAQSGNCFWLNIPMSLKDLFISHSPFAPSVDRLDNDRGYHRDNIVLATRFANKGRGAYNGEDFAERLNGLLSERG